jgi:rapamycin-insensitive companion of mTOR
LQLESLLTQLEREMKIKAGVENMMEVYIRDKKRTKDLEAQQFDQVNKKIESLTKQIEQLRKTSGMIIDIASSITMQPCCSLFLFI